MSHQLTFDELRRARRHDPATSKAAARQSHGLAAQHRLAILQVMRTGSDWTAHEIAERCGLTAVQVCRRFAEMRDDGDIRETPNTRPTPSGRHAQAYEVCR